VKRKREAIYLLAAAGCGEEAARKRGAMPEAESRPERNG